MTYPFIDNRNGSSRYSARQSEIRAKNQSYFRSVKLSPAESARIVEAQKLAYEQNYLSQFHKSAGLIRYSADRGMSRRRMNEIWTRQLVDIVLSHIAIEVAA